MTTTIIPEPKSTLLEQLKAKRSALMALVHESRYPKCPDEETEQERFTRIYNDPDCWTGTKFRL